MPNIIPVVHGLNFAVLILESLLVFGLFWTPVPVQPFACSPCLVSQQVNGLQPFSGTALICKQPCLSAAWPSLAPVR